MENKYYAWLRTGVQVTEDQWDYVTKSIELTAETTVKQIAEWAERYNPANGIHITAHDIIELSNSIE